MNKVLRILAIACGCLWVFAPLAAENDKAQSDAGRICLSTYIDPTSGLKPQAQRILKDRMQRVVTKNGLGSSDNQRFIITAGVRELGRETTATAPVMYVCELEVNFFIGDGIDGTLFASTSLTVKGVDDSEEKAYMSALKKIKVTDPVFKSFIANGKARIVDYFDTNCAFIMKDAMAKADRNEYDASLALLLSVPAVCENCYNQALDASVEVYKRKMNNECQINIAQAKAEIAADNWDHALDYLRFYTPDMDCYPEVSQLVTNIEGHRCAQAIARARAAWANRDARQTVASLSEVSADSQCYAEAQTLQREVTARLDEQERIALEREQREWEATQKQQQDAQDLKMAGINAIRDVAVAFVGEKPLPYNVGAIAKWL